MTGGDFATDVTSEPFLALPMSLTRRRTMIVTWLSPFEMECKRLWDGIERGIVPLLQVEHDMIGTVVAETCALMRVDLDFEVSFAMLEFDEHIRPVPNSDQTTPASCTWELLLYGWQVHGRLSAEAESVGRLLQFTATGAAQRHGTVQEGESGAQGQGAAPQGHLVMGLFRQAPSER